MSKLTDQFKRCVFFVYGKEESEEVQKLLFSLGFVYLNHNPTQKREVINIMYAENKSTGGFIFVDENCRMSYGDTHYFPHMGPEYKLVSKLTLIRVAAEHRLVKKLKKKESKLRKSANRTPSNVVSFQQMVNTIAKDSGWNANAPSLADTNPKRQFGMKSIPLNLWSPLASAYGAVGLYNGSLKYGQGNYKGTPVEASIYIAAAMRHLNAWAEGEEFDPKDKVPNLGGVLANIAILLDARAAGTLIDDRQIRGGYLQEREALEKIVESLQVLHTGKAPRHYSIEDNKD